MTWKLHPVQSANPLRNAAWRAAKVEIVVGEFGPMGVAYTVRQGGENKGTYGDGDGPVEPFLPAMKRAFAAADQLSGWVQPQEAKTS